ncbi:MAG TPA: BTAD domain-containing putative transcriptional regulator [Gemmatimonadaceae bacterium]|jgi:DNA-binding SARP family transcriptional activator/TolB-like protein
MLQLRTLGGAYVLQSDGTGVGGAVAQRRSLALLSILAVHGNGGVSRDRLLGLLWPDGDPEKVRHALTQSLYHIRRALSCGDLFVIAGSNIALNAERISTDVGQMVARADREDHEGVAAAYRGPFLDGFVLSSVEFDQWMMIERNRFQQMASRALEKLGSAAEKRDDWQGAVGAYKHLVALDPLSAPATMRLMRALWSTGDRAGAVQQGRTHAALLHDELEIEPDVNVQRLTDEITAAREVPSPVRLSDVRVSGEVALSSVAVAVVGDESEPSVVATSATAPHPTAASRGRRFAGSRIGRIAIATSAAAVVVVSALSFGRPQAVAEGAIHLNAEPVVVAPFRVSGTDPSLGYLREGLVELLSSRLADDSAAHAIDPGRVIGAWRKEHLTGPADTRSPDAVRIARDLGAVRVIVGGVVGNASKLVVSASLLMANTGETRAQATVEGPVDSITVLVDRLAARLIASSAGEGDRFGDRFTPSLAALRDFLEGQAAYRGGDYARAIPAYERALARDSTFALAALHLALAADGINDAEQHDRALALAWANRADLNERDAAHLVAFAGPRYPEPSLESEQVAAWERALVTAPDRADVWYELGERLFRAGGVAGLMNAHIRAKAVLSRALQLEPEHVRARRLLIMLAARTSDTALLSRIASPAALRDSVGDISDFLRWRVALVRGDSSTLRRIRARLSESNDQSLRSIAMSSIHDAVGFDDGERAAKITLKRADRDGSWFDALMEQHSFALNEGQPRRALDITSQLETHFPGTRAHLRLRVLDAMYAEGDTTAAARAVDSLSVFADGPLSSDPALRELQVSDLCVVEQWRLSHGTTTTARRAITLLRTTPLPRSAIVISTNPRACASILDAMLADATKSRETASRVAALDSLMLSGPAMSDASSYANIVVGRIYQHLGNQRAALVAYRRRSYMTSWLRYLATTRREEAEIAAALGETDIARNSFQRYLALRRQPEPTIAADVATARVHAAHLEASVANR